MSDKPYQPTTTDLTRKAQGIIEGWLGSVDGGCIDERGRVAVPCPYLVYCKGLEPHEAVLCEVSDEQLGI